MFKLLLPTIFAISLPAVGGLFDITEVECRGANRISCEKIGQRLVKAKLTSLFSFSAREWGLPFGNIRSSTVRLLTSDPWIEDARINLIPFSRKLEIIVREATPWFVTDLRGSKWIVSKRGALLQELGSITDSVLLLETSQLPRVLGVEARGADFLGREAERIRKVTQLLSAINIGGGLPFEVESYELLDDFSLAAIPLQSTYPTVFIDRADDSEIRNKFRLLRSVLADSKYRGETLERVDLRLRERAVVRTAQLFPIGD